jgi:60S ribosomal subunit assembly/export protein LOC1
MAPTRTVKNKHAANGSGIKNSKAARGPQSDGIVKSKKPGAKPTPTSVKQLTKKKKKKVYTEKELGIPKLNMITPVGVEKPKGKKKGKVFVDDTVSPDHSNCISGIHMLIGCRRLA